MDEVESEAKGVAPAEASGEKGPPDTPAKSTNGVKNVDEEDTANEAELSPPPDSMSPVSSINNDPDEIVVGGIANGAEKSSPLRVTSDREDEGMVDVDDEPIVSHYPKRKRASVYNDLSEEKIENSLIEEEPEPPRFVKPVKRPLGSVKGVTLGYWRDSPVPNERNRHSVIGFIDIRDRLRTRIQPTTRYGEPVDALYPLPPGPGGSWVTFERVVFDEHLVGLDHYQVKEYVKIRSDMHEPDEESRKAAQMAAIEEAIKRCKANPPPEHLPAPAIAYGPEMPERALGSGRPEAKRRRTGSGIGTISSGGPIAPAVSQVVPQEFISRADPIPGTRPTRILLGYWRGSSEPDPADRHAVYGILGQNDMFRVKVVRETRDGRFVDGNFPSGAGALWIHYEEVEFEQHLKHLTRNEIKEYCRIRQRQLDEGERPDDRVANETQAVYEAQTRVQSGYRSSNYHSQAIQQSLGREEQGTPERRMQHIEPKTDLGPELRQSRRAASQAESRQQSRHSLPDTSGRLPSTDALERTNSIARREIARAEAAQQRIDRHAANREAAMYTANAMAQQQQTPGQQTPPTNGLNGSATAAAAAAAAAANRMRFGDSEDMQRLNTVWAKQEAHRIKSGAEDAKMYLGIKYERKSGGPFAGKLVSQGTIISIDGEDYVEYRVLTKPSFF